MLSEDGFIVIKTCYKEKHWNAAVMIVHEFSNKNLNLNAVKQLRVSDSIFHVVGSGRPRTTRTEVNVAYVKQHSLSQEGQSNIHESQRLMARHVVFTKHLFFVPPSIKQWYTGSYLKLKIY
jgi:hypothetical protein